MIYRKIMVVYAPMSNKLLYALGHTQRTALELCDDTSFATIPTGTVVERHYGAKLITISPVEVMIGYMGEDLCGRYVTCYDVETDEFLFNVGLKI